MYRLLLLTCCLYYTIASAQQSDDIQLFPIQEGILRGYININGDVVIPPKYLEAGQFSEGLAAVREDGYFGYINTKGEYVIQPQYDVVYPFENGYATVYADTIGYNLNKQGIRIKTLTGKDAKFFANLSHDRNKGSIRYSEKDRRYKLKASTPTQYNKHYVIINAEGERVPSDSFKEIRYTFHDIPDFQNGVAFLKKEDEHWSLIDTNGKYIFRDAFENVNTSFSGKEYFFFTYPQKQKYTPGGAKWGIADNEGRIIIEPLFERYDARSYSTGLVYCIIGGRLSYINKKGEIVWQQALPDNEAVYKYNTNHITFPYAKVSSTPKEDNPNISQPEDITEQLRPEKNGLKLFIDTSRNSLWSVDYDEFEMNFEGHALYIINTTDDTVVFNSVEGDLYLRMQAKDTDGEWKNIEDYFLVGLCGNSYYGVYLSPGKMWEISIPRYHGEMKTMLRARLMYRKEKRGKEEATIYSNEIEGTIHPAQFTNMTQYYLQDILSPTF